MRMGSEKHGAGIRADAPSLWPNPAPEGKVEGEASYLYRAVQPRPAAA